jgi:hypothetical protein
METDSKVGRTVRLTSGVNQRLLDLCEHLGVTPNAYLVAEVGKAVARDEISLMVKGQTDSMFASVDRWISEQKV